MAEGRDADLAAIWQCLHCRTPLRGGDSGLHCRGCGKLYPAVADIPLLVREPGRYFATEQAELLRVAQQARRRMDGFDAAELYLGLPPATRARHRDVARAEAAQAETLLALLRPAGATLSCLGHDADALQATHPGWGFDTLVPYLVRDWTGTAELQAASATINAALAQAFPQAGGKSVAFAGCGAGGLLGGVAADFARVIGFDLTLPTLAAARRLLDGATLDLPLPQVLNAAGQVCLRRDEAGTPARQVELVAMDAVETAFADAAVDGVVTVFLTDILADPRALAREVHRVLPEHGVWINYGPSGNNLKALWRFDQTEAAAFFAAAGFTVEHATAQRVTNLDISTACPAASFRNAVCYLTIARKTHAAAAVRGAAVPGRDALWHIVPRHFPNARLVHRLDAAAGNGIALQHDRNPERPQDWALGGRAARMMTLVDGQRTIGDIATLLSQRKPPQAIAETLDAFARFFAQGLLHWHGRNC